MTTKQKQIESILKDMDFKKINSVMEHIGWTWIDSESGVKRVPDIEELSVVAEHCMHTALDDGKNFSVGGFECDIINGSIELRFVIERVNPLPGYFE